MSGSGLRISVGVRVLGLEFKSLSTTLLVRHPGASPKFLNPFIPNPIVWDLGFGGQGLRWRVSKRPIKMRQRENYGSNPSSLRRSRRCASTPDRPGGWGAIAS